jgi:hypothetical protein
MTVETFLIGYVCLSGIAIIILAIWIAKIQNRNNLGNMEHINKLNHKFGLLLNELGYKYVPETPTYEICRKFLQTGFYDYIPAHLERIKPAKAGKETYIVEENAISDNMKKEYWNDVKILPVRDGYIDKVRKL